LIDAIPSFENYIMAELLYKRKIENSLCFSDFEKKAPISHIVDNVPSKIA